MAADKNSDLFWGLRGAGHNFGVVTSFVVKAYNAGEPWTLITLTFTQDKLESFLETWNTLEEVHPDRGMLVVNGILARNNDVDSEHVSILNSGGLQMRTVCKCMRLTEPTSQ